MCFSRASAKKKKSRKKKAQDSQGSGETVQRAPKAKAKAAAESSSSSSSSAVAVRSATPPRAMSSPVKNRKPVSASKAPPVPRGRRKRPVAEKAPENDSVVLGKQVYDELVLRDDNDTPKMYAVPLKYFK